MSEKLIAEIAQGELASLQIRVGVWDGRPRIDIRIFSGPARARRPTQKGLCVRPSQIDEVIDGMLAARREAIRLGWPVKESGAK